MIVTISGKPGSGKTTVAKKLSEKLDYNFYSMGDLRRKMALDRGMSISELNELGEKEDFTDKEVDEYQKELGKKEDNFVIEGRLSFFFISNSLKVYLDAESEIRSERIFNDKRESEKYGSLNEVEGVLSKRVESDMRRYDKYYGVNCYDVEKFDLIIDTSDISTDEVVDLILKFIEKK